MGTLTPGPGVCFVSHSYGDEAALAACMKSTLPGRMRGFVFPAIAVTPLDPVSDRLIAAIRDCEGFIYLDTPRSRGSFWVGFERNVAARLGKAVHAFRPNRPLFKFVRDRRPAVDPVVAVLFNMCVAADLARIQVVRDKVWDRYRFEIRGDKWRRLDNDERQMLDSIDGLRDKYAAGGVTVLFLSNVSITGGYHDYADPYTFRRAQKDMEAPIGHTAEKFAAINPKRTVFVWLEQPDTASIERSLTHFDEVAWRPYVRVIRHALAEERKLVAFQADGSIDLSHLDNMLARCFATAIDSDARVAAEFRHTLINAN